VAGEFTKLRNLVTGGVTVGAEPEENGRWRWQSGAQRVVFKAHLLPHSYSVFMAEK
jgi:hypothetical protein